MERPGITVVTVALNAAADLPLTIESVLEQSYPDTEYLLIDGLSHDSSYDVLARYDGRIDQVIPVEDGGVYEAMNEAAARAQHEFVVFLNAGDRFYCADAVEAMVLRRRGDPDVFHGDHVYVEGRLESHMRSADFDWLRKRLLHGRIDRDWHLKFPSHQATFTRTSLLRELAYDTRYSICADHEFLLRAFDAGARFQYIDEIVAHYFAGGISGAQGTPIHREWAHAYRKHSLRPTAIDKFFFQTAAASPFPSQTSYSGLLLGGAQDEEIHPETGERWRWANHVELAGPSELSAVGLELKGTGLYGEQVLSVTADGRHIGGLAMGEGPIALRCAFVEPIRPGQAIQISPQPTQDVGAAGRPAAWGFEELIFLPAAELRSHEINFAAASIEVLDELLIEGWAQPEVGNGQIWSDVEQASIAFSYFKPVSSLAIECSGNPYAAGGQDLSIVVNGRLAGAFKLEPETGFAVCQVDVDGLWREDANIVRFCVDTLANVPGEERSLGLALRRIYWN